jgi:chemotaxis protein CheX
MSQIFDAALMNAFLDGAIDVLKTMCRTDPKPLKPALKKKRVLSGDVSGVISLRGSGMHGIVVLSFSKAAILRIVSRMLMEEHTEISAEIKDAVGELTNMIAGSSRRNLEAVGLPFEAGIPTIVMGAHHDVFTIVSERAPTISIPFETDRGEPFRVEFTLEEEPDRDTPRDKPRRKAHIPTVRDDAP